MYTAAAEHLMVKFGRLELLFSYNVNSLFLLAAIAYWKIMVTFLFPSNKCYFYHIHDGWKINKYLFFFSSLALKPFSFSPNNFGVQIF